MASSLSPLILGFWLPQGGRFVIARPPQRARFFTENDYSPLVNKREGLAMSLSPPTTVVFVVSIILAALAIIGKFVMIPVITDQGFWVAVLAYIILACGNIFRGF
jgi:uncharacterized membrane protein (DUF485 family)